MREQSRESRLKAPCALRKLLCSQQALATPGRVNFRGRSMGCSERQTMHYYRDTRAINGHVTVESAPKRLLFTPGAQVAPPFGRACADC